MSLDTLYRNKYEVSVKQMKARCGSYEDAEDIVQNAFERCVRFQESIGNVEACFPFILKNCFTDWQREKRDNGMVRNMEEEDHNIADPVDFDEDIQHIRQLIKHKKGTYGEVLNLYFNEDFTQEEISAITNVHQPNVARYLSRFKQELIKEK